MKTPTDFYITDLELHDLTDYFYDEGANFDLLDTLTAGRLESEQREELTH